MTRHLRLFFVLLFFAFSGCSSCLDEEEIPTFTDPCDADPCQEPGRTVCLPDDSLDDGYACLCEPGTSEDADGACVPDQGCTETTCAGHGECIEDADGPRCECYEGYAGPHCTACDEDAGFYDDGNGQCTDDLCDPDPCVDDLPGGVCVIEDGQASCQCQPGTVEVDGVCELEQTCSPNSCNGNGDCSETDVGIQCDCDHGYTGQFCNACDEDSGFHDDGTGTGTCTDDPCTPNPCTADNQSICDFDGVDVQCLCDDGFHDDGFACVEDEVCLPDSCSGNGACAIVDGLIDCICDEGYAGADCSQCDTGFHDDGTGSGTCTDDVCLPNPCDAPNKGICQESASTTSGYVCLCDDGFHDDGVGGCTDDPCTPNPCAAQNQACEPDGASYVCYTPECDDGNPCTENSLVNGVCETADRTDGAACSDTLCVSDQTCHQGTCQGGTPVICDDDNPCTADTCDPITGCQHTPDDSLIPDDGASCTESFCEDGQAYHVPDDDACGGSFCTGEGVCDPNHAAANADGCYFLNAPTPPSIPTSPCRYYGACDDAAGEFLLIELPEGSPCDDGLACTENATCTASGACVGQVIDGCFGASCDATAPFSGTIDVSRAEVTGDITLGGDDWPTISRSSQNVTFFMRDRDTGVLHRLYQLNYNLLSGATEFPLNGNTPPFFHTAMPTGVYDLIYQRGLSNDIVFATDVLDPVPMGFNILQEEVVIGPGLNTLNIDVPRAEVTGDITLGGDDWPTISRSSQNVTFFMRDRDTGVLHRLYQLNYNLLSGATEFPLNSNTPPSFETALPSGSYDLIYQRGLSNDTVFATNVLDPVPMGFNILQEDVVISPGQNTLDIDVSRAEVTGDITLGGDDWPTISRSSQNVIFWMRDRDTGVLHRLYQLNYNLLSGATEFPLNSNTPPFFETGLPSGTYDLIYQRGLSNDTVFATDVLDPVPMGYRSLNQCILID